ncbi:glycosyltransferase family 2 protein [Aeromonas caviae]|uniref:glycosyltransferase family 2 protein n=1 Tax=Aeromonas caviae TaxID=648 RepID=UPI0029DC6E54|nr:glycosyltransferase family 2 protein [Aeromonas caviae]MDX7676377.1 glycosyltransferase family 2 protein [Aeromonas caviae]
MIYISIVSHGHADMIQQLNCASVLAQNAHFKVILKDNKGEAKLETFCKKNNIYYYAEPLGLGFGANNNYVFSKISNEITDDDYFIVLNPDVLVSCSEIISAIDEMKLKHTKVGTINLFRDDYYSVYDCSVRNFPSLKDFIGSYIGLENKTIIDKSAIKSSIFVDWAAGSFIIFNASLYKKLKGFNEKYFMYCEDIDICWRAYKIAGEKVYFMPAYKAVHFAQFNNRQFFSKHFFWHVMSAIRFVFYRYGLFSIRGKSGE